MKATKKTLFTIGLASLFVVGLAVAQSSSAANEVDSAGTTTATSTAATGNDNAGDFSALVFAIESDGDLTDVADAIADSGSDLLLASLTEGVTIFAPVDGSFPSDVLIEDVITEYIVPVMLETSDMTADTTVTSLGGTPVEFTVFDEELLVNGVPVVDLEGIYSGNVVIYKLSDSFDGDGLASTK